MRNDDALPFKRITSTAAFDVLALKIISLSLTVFLIVMSSLDSVIENSSFPAPSKNSSATRNLLVISVFVASTVKLPLPCVIVASCPEPNLIALFSCKNRSPHSLSAVPMFAAPATFG